MNNDFIHYGRNRNTHAIITESTQKILDEENIVIDENDSSEQIVKKVSKSKKVVAKVKEDGTVSIKQSLNG